MTPGLLNLQRTLERCCCDSAIEHLDMISDTSWVRRWHPDIVPMSQAHIVVRPLTGRVLLEAVRFRYGYGRRIAGWLRSSRKRPTRRELTAGKHVQAD